MTKASGYVFLDWPPSPSVSGPQSLMEPLHPGKSSGGPFSVAWAAGDTRVCVVCMRPSTPSRTWFYAQLCLPCCCGTILTHHITSQAPGSWFQYPSQQQAHPGGVPPTPHLPPISLWQQWQCSWEALLPTQTAKCTPGMTVIDSNLTLLFVNTAAHCSGPQRLVPQISRRTRHQRGWITCQWGVLQPWIDMDKTRQFLDTSLLVDLCSQQLNTAQVKKEQASRPKKRGCFLTEIELRLSRYILIFSFCGYWQSLFAWSHQGKQVFPRRVSCKKFLAPEREKAAWIQDLLG